MQRLLVTVLVALSCFWLVSPEVFAPVSALKAPSCCRRNGQHHCTMTASRTESSSGPAMQPARCPLFPGAQGVPARPPAGPLGIGQSLFAAIVSHPASHPQTEALCRISFSRADQKRGPPFFVA